MMRLWLSLVLSATTLTAQAADLPKILSDKAVRAAHPLPDFSYAGYEFGLGVIPSDPGTIIDVTTYGAVPDDGLDDTKAVLRAQQAANAVNGKVTLRFPKGRTQITEVLRITRSDFVMDGAGDGPGGSELYFPRPLKMIDDSQDFHELRQYLVREKKYEVQPEHNINYLFSEYSWAGGMIFVGPDRTRPASYDPALDRRDQTLAKGIAGKQFDRIVTVDDTSRLTVGGVLRVEWFATAGKDSPILKSLYGDTDLPIGSHHWTSPDRAVVAQSTRIVAIRGKRVTLGDPLLHDVRADQPAVLSRWDHLTRVGIQNLRLQFPESPSFGHHLEQGYNGIYMTGVFDGWIQNLTIDKSDSGILTDNAASLTIKDIVTSGDRRAHYSVHVGATHNVLVENLTVENPVIHPLSVNTRSTRAVFLRAQVKRDAVIDQHSGSNHQNLFDQISMWIDPAEKQGEWRYRLWVGGGASYWKPGHGLYNTVWNARLIIPDSVPPDAAVTITSGLEGPGERIIGLHANRPLDVRYTPQPYIEGTGKALDAVPSLYEYQRAQRQ
ncbi:hypothetical protein CHU95_20780 [Niveispirillum lacus]|uniref:Pectate lyase superfamily protein domain-containing protein n=1 Tax=Niveispirillum lacus TaxID=1981099 RepID=A0A255YT10_9PROT|nr:hypothetical protein [Niveispirillum lacus]OYQ31580.1 hypothetical protein CHU95_20780 [Niveispirillum lacus]